MYLPPTSSNVIHLFGKHPILLVVTIIVGLTFSGATAGFASHSDAYVDKSLVTFTFDDNYLSTYSIAYPILNEYNYKATVFVPTDFIGKPGYMSEQQLFNLKMYGWDIGSHTKTHTDMVSLTSSQVQDELTMSRDRLTSINMGAPVGFASPLGSYDASIVAEIKSVYVYQRTCDPGYNDIPPGDAYYLKSMVIKSDTTVKEVKGWIDYAYANHKWLILTLHRLDDSGEYSWSSQNLEEIAQYLHDKEYTSS